MQRSWPKPLAAMSWSWLPNVDDATVGESHDDGGALMGHPRPMRFTNKANDYYRAARRSTRRR
jgi:hypothetical protein